jgi:D-galacturonate reductase
MTRSALIVGAGEYVTGLQHGACAASDKKSGVLALTLFDLRRRGMIDDISICARDGSQFDHVRSHFQLQLASRYAGLDVRFTQYPPPGQASDKAFLEAIAAQQRGGLCFVATPDDTHYQIARAAIEHGLHVHVLKPLVHRLSDQEDLIARARRASVILAIDYHKRFDEIYLEARGRIRQLGPMSYFNSYMSQPKSQLETFRAWAGKSSDISYYLNAHHIDFHCWALEGRGQPQRVTAHLSSGVASELLKRSVEDTIVLAVDWKDIETGLPGIATYAASWIAPPADVHSQQRFFYLGARGELRVDQAHRGYTGSSDTHGFVSLNPLFMNYTPDDGRFAGQQGYGYRSFEAFVLAAQSGPEYGLDARLATADRTLAVTAILEAGRRSLDAGGAPVAIDWDDAGTIPLPRLRTL